MAKSASQYEMFTKISRRKWRGSAICERNQAASKLSKKNHQHRHQRSVIIGGISSTGVNIYIRRSGKRNRKKIEETMAYGISYSRLSA